MHHINLQENSSKQHDLIFGCIYVVLNPRHPKIHSESRHFRRHLVMNQNYHINLPAGGDQLKDQRCYGHSWGEDRDAWRVFKGGRWLFFSLLLMMMMMMMMMMMTMMTMFPSCFSIWGLSKVAVYRFTLQNHCGKPPVKDAQFRVSLVRVCKVLSSKHHL